MVPMLLLDRTKKSARRCVTHVAVLHFLFSKRCPFCLLLLSDCGTSFMGRNRVCLVCREIQPLGAAQSRASYDLSLSIGAASLQLTLTDRIMSRTGTFMWLIVSSELPGCWDGVSSHGSGAGSLCIRKSLDQEQMSQVLDAMFEKLVKCGEHVIDQGDDGDNFYVIDRGTYDIFVKSDGVVRCVGAYDNRGSFGELALMYNTPRAATIVATSVGSIWGLDRATFRRIIVKNNAKKKRMYENFIESLPFLKSLEFSERLKVVDVIGTKTYYDGEQIIAQGDGADSFYIVESGEVRINMKSKSKPDAETNEAVEIARYTRGQYFGELALVTNKPRAASAYAVGNVKCLVMDVQAFERLLGPCMEIMKRNIANYEEQLVALFGTNMDITDPST